ncbi:MAG: hybrid sensor histidine kinase/response regulator [Ramlibacter sp.]|nr:hybrid sensor histidine kinase/response regulator [Ramlibacter sp.]
MIDRASYSILVVDDNVAAKYALSRGLRAAGFRTVEASAGAEALELSEFVSAVVLDVHLPDVHGYEVCRLIRKRQVTATLPVVHVSALYTSESDQLAGAQAGSDGYMVAPVDPDQLACTLDGLLLARQGPA